jgi:predicted dehydrogenase
MSARTLRLGVLGLGYWGANVARNVDRLPGCELAWCCDPDPGRRREAELAFPRARIGSDLDDLLADDVDAVAVVTPVPTHAELAERVLRAGCHCFVEKPLARGAAEAAALAELAARAERVLMVGHLLEYHPAVEALRRLIAAGELGEVHYIHCQRLNLGKLRADENALWSLGAHDVSVVLTLLGETPTEVSARGASYVRPGVEDVVFGHLRFPSGVLAQLHLSWLDPHKERRITVVGAHRMASFDDMAPERKLTVFDKGFDLDEAVAGAYIVRSGETHSPAIDRTEPLRLELEHFAACVREGGAPRTDGRSGVRVVRVLEGLQRSLEAGGEPVDLETGASA